MTIAASVYGPALHTGAEQVGMIREVLDAVAPVPGDHPGLVTAMVPADRLHRLAPVRKVVHVGPATTEVQAFDEGASQVLAGNIATPRSSIPATATS